MPRRKVGASGRSFITAALYLTRALECILGKLVQRFY
jgi:hypothetical protein